MSKLATIAKDAILNYLDAVKIDIRDMSLPMIHDELLWLLDENYEFDCILKNRFKDISLIRIRCLIDLIGFWELCENFDYSDMENNLTLLFSWCDLEGCQKVLNI